MSIKTPRLTRDRCSVFCIRLVVPKALRADIGKSELRRSLRTKDCSVAKQRALTLNLALEAALTNPKISDFEHLCHFVSNSLVPIIRRAAVQIVL